MTGAGKLNQRITLERRDVGRDALGQPVESWVPVATVWADIRFPSGVSAIKGGADVSVVRASLRIRARAGLDAGMRAVQTSARYDIKAVLPTRDRQYIDLVCEVIS